MKQYVRASNGYNDIFRKITQYFVDFAETNGATYTTYNDYVVEPDWAGGGIRITLQWDGATPSEVEVGNAIENYFGSGVRCSDAWGSWNHQIIVHVAESRCR